MVARFQTASGLRFYVCARMNTVIYNAIFDGNYTLEFLDPIEPHNFKTRIELIFESKTAAKHCKLNNKFLHACLKRSNITPKSIFIFDVDDTLEYPQTLTINNTYNLLAKPSRLIEYYSK